MKKNGKKELEHQIKDWVVRLDTLYRKIDRWRKRVPGTEAIPDKMQQLEEGLMKEYHIKPQLVPTYTVLAGKNRVSFVPSLLWLYGAKGRINVTTNKGQYTLMDLGKPETASCDWQMVTPDFSKIFVPFNEDTFMKLLKRG